MKLTHLILTLTVIATLFALSVRMIASSVATPPQVNPLGARTAALATALDTTILRALSGNRTIAGPGLVQSSASGSTDHLWTHQESRNLSVAVFAQNLGDTPVQIKFGSNVAFTLQPGASGCFSEMVLPAFVLSYSSSGAGQTAFAWAVRLTD